MYELIITAVTNHDGEYNTQVYRYEFDSAEDMKDALDRVANRSMDGGQMRNMTMEEQTRG